MKKKKQFHVIKSGFVECPDTKNKLWLKRNDLDFFDPFVHQSMHALIVKGFSAFFCQPDFADK